MYFLPFCGQQQHKTQPANYLAGLIGHEGEGSLLSFLKSENLATGLGASSFHWADCLTIFMIDVQLTKNALDKTERVAEITYKYL